MKYYLDTNIIIYAINGRYPAIAEHFKIVNPSLIAIPSIVTAEIEYGARKSRDYNTTMELYNSFFSAFKIVSFDNDMASKYGIIRSELEKDGKIIGPNDLIIASTVLARDGILVTNNVKEFKRVEGLELEDWTKQ